MKVIRLTFFAVCLSLVTGIGFYAFNIQNVSHAAATPNASAGSNASGGTMAPVSYADAVALAAPAVVSIKTTKEIPMEMNPMYQDPFFRYFFGEPHQMDGQPNMPGPGVSPGPGTNPGMGGKNPNLNPNPNQPKEVLQELGSGVIVSDKGYILTNYHLIRDVDSVIVTLADGRTAEAKVVGSDPDTDIAVLQIKLDKLPVIQIGSSAKLRPGDVALAIGNPFGLDKTVTHGIISATERASPPDLALLENMIQTDAAINPGNSGGALIDSTGKLIGINTYIYSRSGGSMGIGFAIPVDLAQDIMTKLIEGKVISRGYLGVSLQVLTKEIRDAINYKDDQGVYVRAIVRGSPAQKSGLIPGDVIIKINNTPIKDDRMAVQLVAGLKPGQSYPVEIFRKGDYMTFTVTLGERKQAQLQPTQTKDQSKQANNQ